MIKVQNVYISGTGRSLPDRVLHNDEIEKLVDTDHQWVVDNVGVHERRIAEPGQYTSDFASDAGLKAIENAGLEKADIDMVILATATPDRLAPSSACLTKQKMGLSSNCAAFDVSAVCTGFVYALYLASSLVSAGSHKNVLIIGGDTFSKITDWKRRDCVFFGDGAGAAIVSHSSSKESFFTGEICSDTAETHHFTVYEEDQFFTMNGRAVFDTATSVLPSSVRNVLKEQRMETDQIDHVIPHQPSIRILKTLAHELGIPFSKFNTNMDRYANTSGGTVPILLDELNESGALRYGDIVLFAAVGSGWTWGSALSRWLKED